MFTFHCLCWCQGDDKKDEDESDTEEKEKEEELAALEGKKEKDTNRQMMKMGQCKMTSDHDITGDVKNNKEKGTLKLIWDHKNLVTDFILQNFSQDTFDQCPLSIITNKAMVSTQ